MRRTKFRCSGRYHSSSNTICPSNTICTAGYHLSAYGQYTKPTAWHLIIPAKITHLITDPFPSLPIRHASRLYLSSLSVPPETPPIPPRPTSPYIPFDPPPSLPSAHLRLKSPDRSLLDPATTSPSASVTEIDHLASTGLDQETNRDWATKLRNTMVSYLPKFRSRRGQASRSVDIFDPYVWQVTTMPSFRDLDDRSPTFSRTPQTYPYPHRAPNQRANIIRPLCDGVTQPPLSSPATDQSRLPSPSSRLCSPSHRPHRPSLIYSRPSNHSLSLLALSTVSPTSISLIRPKMSCVSWIDTSSHPVHDEHRTSPRPRPNDQTFRFASTRDLERTPRPRDPDRHILHKP